jgi:hypothetical protein
MSRSGYADDCDNIGLWRAAVSNATYGKRGQKFLREMADALDAMPVKELVADAIVRDEIHVCAIGSVAVARGLDVSKLDVTDGEGVAKTFGIARALACEIAYENDECGDRWGKDAEGNHVRLPHETPAQRWTRMRRWVAAQIVSPSVSPSHSADDSNRKK